MSSAPRASARSAGRARPAHASPSRSGRARARRSNGNRRALAAAWQAPEPLICVGHHFSMLEGLNGGALLDLALRTAGEPMTGRRAQAAPASRSSAGARSAGVSSELLSRVRQSGRRRFSIVAIGVRSPARAQDIPAGASPCDRSGSGLPGSTSTLVAEAAGQRGRRGSWGESSLALRRRRARGRVGRRPRPTRRCSTAS
jgi:hypothetical protein